MSDADPIRQRVADAKRVVVKVGSSSLTTPSHGLDTAKLEALVAVLAQHQRGGQELVLVTSGAIAAGMEPLGLLHRPRDLARQQAAAAVGQGLLLARYADSFAAHGVRVAQVLLTLEDVTRRESYANALRTLTTLVEMGIVPIVNENDTVATHEICFGDNDRLAALVAELVRAEALVLLTDVDALYTTHPAAPAAQRIDFVADIDRLQVDTTHAGSHIGSGGMTTKLEAAHAAALAGIPTVLTNADQVRAALSGAAVGTCFAAVAKPQPRRLLWLAHAAVAQGRLHLDAGAAAVVLHNGASLLPAGITAISGNFEAGDPVELVAPDGAVVARGLVNFSSIELPDMIGRRTADLAAEMGAEYNRVVVHRDSMTITPRP